MKFGKVENPGILDLQLPEDHPDTKNIILNSTTEKSVDLRVGCAKLNKQYLQNFYPKGTGKKELEYYSSQFNAIEFNAFFYRIFPEEMVVKWYERSDDSFKFFPKIPQSISQFRRLKNCEEKLDLYFKSISHFNEKLGTCFLQMHPTFKPDKIQDLKDFLESWPKDVKLSIELRHTDWYNDLNVFENLQQLLVENHVSSTITDTAGRRDLIHMRLSTPSAFVRFTGANHKSDYTRLDQWVDRVVNWVDYGLDELNFFIHQNMGIGSPLLASYFIDKLNNKLRTSMMVPKLQPKK